MDYEQFARGGSGCAQTSVAELTAAINKCTEAVERATEALARACEKASAEDKDYVMDRILEVLASRWECAEIDKSLLLQMLHQEGIDVKTAQSALNDLNAMGYECSVYSNRVRLSPEGFDKGQEIIAKEKA